MNWKLCRDAEEALGIIDEWSEFRIMRPEPLSALDLLHELRQEHGDDDRNVVKIRDGLYFIKFTDGWRP